MKRKLALLLAAALLLCALPLNALAAVPCADTVCAVTQIPLNPVQTQVLALLETAIRARQDAADLRGYHIGLSELIDVINELNRNPEFFYFDYAMPSFDFETDEVFEVELTYKEEYGAAELAAFEQAVGEGLAQLLPGMSDLQKALVLHDWLALHIVYDYDNYKADTVPEDSYNAYGALVKGIAVCEGYAKAYQVLLGRCGIDAVMVSSLDMDHGWNLVKLGECWYHVDVTWDDPNPDTLGSVTHAFFLLSDSAIRGRASAGGDLHYGWDGDIRCTDTSYDGTVAWSGCDDPLVFTDASTVWTVRGAGKGPEQRLDLIMRNWSSGAETICATVCDYWPVWNESKYWTGCYSGLCGRSGWLYFNDSLHIYGYDPQDGSLYTVMDYDGGDGYLYGLASAVDGLRYLVRRSPGEQGRVCTLYDDYDWPEPEPAPAPEPAPGPDTSGENPFTDISPFDRWYDAVIWAYETGVTTGTSATTFSPDQSCSRGQVITFLWRAAGKPEPSSRDNPFADVKESDYFFKAVLWAVEWGITNGTGTDEATGKQLFDPGKTCSYAYILTFIYRAVTGNLKSAGAFYDDALLWARENDLLADTLVGRDAGRVNADCPRSDLVLYLWRFTTGR